MKKSSKISPETNYKVKTIPEDEPYQLTYANPNESEFHLKYSKEARVSAHMARWFLDYEYNQLIWSDGVYELLEIDPLKNSANYFTYLELIHPNDRYIKIAANENLKKTKKPIEINYRLLFNDGRIKWVNEICNTDFSKERKPIRSYGTIQDITRFKLSEEDFNQRRERFKSLIDSIPAGIVIVQNNKFSFVNPAGRNLLNGDFDGSLIGKNISTILLPQMAKSFKKKFKNVLRGQIEPTFETTFRKYSGLEFEAETTLIHTTFKGEPAVELVLNDITERRRAERLLKLNETRLKETVATKDKFLSIIAHDLRGPFTSIIGLLDLLENQYEELDDEERRSYLKLINENTGKTLRLLDNLLVWAKAQTGKISFDPVNQRFPPLVKHVAETLDSQMRLKKIELKTSIPEDIEIYADTNMLRTIVRNLLSNAIKYSNIDGIISISAENIGTHIQVVITDDGIGMEDDVKNKIFKIEEHISTPGTANETGSGLGLILCKDFVEKHNGTISVESQPMQGSKFVLLFPKKMIF